jgi:hypothetical protein
MFDDEFVEGLSIGVVVTFSIMCLVVLSSVIKAYKRGQAEAMSGIVRVHQVTNEVGEVKWEYVK